MFPSKYIHLGGDETNDGCWDQKKSIKTFMDNNGIKNYFDLQTYYRKR